MPRSGITKDRTCGARRTGLRNTAAQESNRFCVGSLGSRLPLIVQPLGLFLSPLALVLVTAPQDCRCK